MTHALMEVRDLSVCYPGDTGLLLRGGRPLLAVDSVNLELDAGEAVGIVGESGAGKSTLARCMGALQPWTSGSVRFDGEPLDPTHRRSQRRRIQIVFQDPFASLNPRRSVGSVLTELLTVNRIVPRREARTRAAELIQLVGLSADALDRRPRAFSGGQRQRIGIARALALAPDLLIADEPVSALDVSVQASILKLLKSLQREFGLTIAFVSHDLGVVRDFCDRCVVMRDGRVVEQGAIAEIFDSPQDPYTRELLAAVPRLPELDDVFGRELESAPGDPPLATRKGRER